MFVLNKEFLFLKNILKLDETIVLRIFLNQILVKAINVETNFIEKEISDCKVLEDGFFVFGKLFETDFNESVFFDNFFEDFLNEFFF